MKNRVKGSQAVQLKLRCRGLWDAFNTFWHGVKDGTGKSPNLAEVTEWYRENSAQVWPQDDDRPSLDDTIKHGQGMRSKPATRMYHRAYRQAKRTCQEGVQDGSTHRDSRPSERDDAATGGLEGRLAKKRAVRSIGGGRDDAAGNDRRATDDDGNNDDSDNNDATTCPDRSSAQDAENGGNKKYNGSNGSSGLLHAPRAVATAPPAVTAVAEPASPKPTSQDPNTAACNRGLDDRPRAPHQQPQRATRIAGLAALSSASAANVGNKAATAIGKKVAQASGRGGADGGAPRDAAHTQPAGSVGSRGSAAAAAALPMASGGGSDAGKPLATETTRLETGPQGSPRHPMSASLAVHGASGPSPLRMLSLNGGVGPKHSRNSITGSSSNAASGTENVPPLLQRRELSVGSGPQRCLSNVGEQPRMYRGALGVRPPEVHQHAEPKPSQQQDCTKPNTRPPLYPRFLQQQEQRDASVLQLQNLPTAAHEDAFEKAAHSQGAEAGAAAQTAKSAVPAVARAEGLTPQQQQPRAVLAPIPALVRAEQALRPASASDSDQQRMDHVFWDVTSGAVPLELLLAPQQAFVSKGGNALSLGTLPDRAGRTLASTEAASNRSASMGSAVESSMGSCSAHSDAGGVRRSSTGASTSSRDGSASRASPSWGLMPAGLFDPVLQQHPAAYGGYDPSCGGYPAFGAIHPYGVYGTDWYGVGGAGYPAYYQQCGMTIPYYYACSQQGAVPSQPASVADFQATAFAEHPQLQGAPWEPASRGQHGSRGSQMPAAVGNHPTRPSAALPGVRISVPAPSAAAATSSRALAPPQQARAPAQQLPPVDVSSYNRNAYVRLPHREYEAFQEKQLDALYQSHISSCCGGEVMAMTPEPDDEFDAEAMAWEKMFTGATRDTSELLHASADGRTVEAAAHTTWLPAAGGMDGRDDISTADAAAAWGTVSGDFGDETLQDVAAEFDRYLQDSLPALPVKP